MTIHPMNKSIGAKDLELRFEETSRIINEFITLTYTNRQS